MHYLVAQAKTPELAAAQNEVLIIHAKLQTSEQLVTIQKTALKQQSQSLDIFSTLAETAQVQINNLTTERDNAHAKTQRALQNVETLGASERKLALKNPYAQVTLLTIGSMTACSVLLER
jgi:hypothetical protein